MTRYLGLLLLAFVTAWVVVLVVGVIARSRLLVDSPNERSSHVAPVPRLGGVGIVAGIVVAVVLALRWGIVSDRSIVNVVIWTVAMATLGLTDDLRPLRSGLRFGVQLVLATSYCVVTGPVTHLGLPWGESALASLSWPFSVLWLVWMTNLYNFMDGIDGIAGVQAVAAGLSFSVVSAQVGDPSGVALGVATCASTLGFLCFNWSPASIFMGDVGSTALGFMFGALTMRYSNQPIARFPFVAGAMILSVFIFDATFTLIRRVFGGEKWHQAHRTHLYQLPQTWGVGHGKVALVALALMGCVALAGITYWRSTDRMLRSVLLTGALALLGGVGALIYRTAGVAQGRHLREVPSGRDRNP